MVKALILGLMLSSVIMQAITVWDRKRKAKA